VSIIFKKLRYQNLLSTGNQFTEIFLNKSKSTLVVGKNGAGKSSFIEALTFALYGRSFRNINKPQLINSITGKGLLVELEFSSNNKDYMIRRGMKPNVFEIYQSGSLLNQNADAREYQDILEKNILKLNYKSFCQVVVLGSTNFVPFMQLSAMQRREVVEDLLDIQVFSTMNSILKDKVAANKHSLFELDYNIGLLEQKIELHKKHINSLKQNNDELVEQKRTKIDEHVEKITQHTNDVCQLTDSINQLNEQVADEKKTKDKQQKLVQMESSLEERLRKLTKEIQFFHDHDSCPTCKQGIDHTFKTSTISARISKQTEIQQALEKLEQEVVTTNSRIQEIANINKQLQKLNEKINYNNNNIRFLNQSIAELNKEIDQLRQQGKKIETDYDETERCVEELEQSKKQKETLLKEKSLLDVASHLLKDSGIKTKIIKQYAPIMNKLINKYLAAMDFFVNFELDESFNETIKSRHRDNFSYDSFSEGEKARLDLALMFTWRAIATLRNSASTNLLIMDEVFDGSLDNNGASELLEILTNLTADSNVFIISHKSDGLYDKFHSVIKFEKHGNFSRISP
jgi:DNA repair exonuclease SbcCD ATPase subunit